MAFIDGEVKLLASLSTEDLVDRLKRPADFKEWYIIGKILESRGVTIRILNTFGVSQDITSPNFPSVFDNPLLDPTRFKSCVAPAKDDSDLKINVKRRNIKFNFNN